MPTQRDLTAVYIATIERYVQADLPSPALRSAYVTSVNALMELVPPSDLALLQADALEKNRRLLDQKEEELRRVNQHAK